MPESYHKIPQPFLGPLFKRDVTPIIATGFNYHAGEIAVHRVKTHSAIDFDVPRGTEILAPADGYYLATYGEYLLRDKDGAPRMLSPHEALSRNPANKDIRPPVGGKPEKMFFGSFVVQGWHGKGRYTQYAHVDWVNPEIPYYPPRPLLGEDGAETGDLAHHAVLRAPVKTYRQSGVTKNLKAGTVIATVGMTGCGWGARCYDAAAFDGDRRPDFTRAAYTYYTQPHLHFAVFGPRAPRTRKPVMYDPFGIYGEHNQGYPQSSRQWSVRQPAAKHAPLCL